MTANNTSNNPTLNGARAAGSKRRVKVAEEVFGVYITKQPSIVTQTAAPNISKTTTKPTWSRLKARVLVWCSALDLPEQYEEPGRPYIAFSANEMTRTVASTHREKGTWPFGPLPIIRLAPRPWPFVERCKSTISLGERDKVDVTRMNEGQDKRRANGMKIKHTWYLFTAKRLWRRNCRELNRSLTTVQLWYKADIRMPSDRLQYYVM